jgi:hypothetical protein
VKNVPLLHINDERSPTNTEHISFNTTVSTLETGIDVTVLNNAMASNVDGGERKMNEGTGLSG